MVLHGVIIGPAIRQILRKGFGHIYRAVNLQDRLIDKAWSRAKFNRNVRRGVRHGAGGGAIIGTLLYDDDSENLGTDDSNPTSPPSKIIQTRRRYTRRTYPGRSTEFPSDRRRRCARPRKYYTSRSRKYR